MGQGSKPDSSRSGAEDSDGACVGAAHPRHDKSRSTDDDRIGIANDPGPDFEDPEGWMSERLDYWIEPAATAPTRGAWLWHRLAQGALHLHAIAARRLDPKPEHRPTAEEWARLAAQAFETRRCPSCGRWMPEDNLRQGLDDISGKDEFGGEA
jgi:hypothetical protein